MEVIPGSVVDNGNGQRPPKGGGRPAAGEKARGGAKPEKKGANGRKGADKVPAVKKPKVVAEKLDYMVELEQKAAAARTEADEAVNAVAEESGYLASSVKKLVKAKHGDKFEEKHREVEQQAELFDEASK